MSLLWSPMHAGTVLSIQPGTSSANPGGSGAFNVVLTNTGTSGVSIGGFAFQVSVASPDITLTGADFSSVPTYIFAGHSFDMDFSLPLNTDSGATLDAIDSYDVALSGIILGAGQSLGLGEVFFSVANPAATGPFPVTFTGSPTIGSNNDLGDANGNTFAIDSFVNGSIDIVPEPTSLLLMAAGTAGLLGLRRRRA